MSKVQGSLFDTAAVWKAKPIEAFTAFVLTPEFVKLGRRKPEYVDSDTEPKPLHESSAQIYILMFSNFSRWMEGQGKTLFTLGSHDIMRFLSRREKTKSGVKPALNSAIQTRYLRVLERVFAHLQIRPNPAQAAAFDALQSGTKLGQDLGKVALTELQHEQFMAALPEADSPADTRDWQRGWKRRRDRAMQAMMLGAGLKVSEVIRLRTRSVGKIDENGSIPVSVPSLSPAGASRPHRTQLRPFAVPEVQAWIEQRRQMKIPGPLLFPATLEGGELNKATVYRQVKATFARAGLEVPRTGGRTLRNSFAFRELKTEPVELVGEFLGHKRLRSTIQFKEEAERRSATRKRS